MLTATINDDQKIPLYLSPKDTAELPVTVTSPLTAVVTSGDGTVEINGSTIWLKSGTAGNSTVYTVTVTGNLGEGISSYPLSVTLVSKPAGTLPEGASLNPSFGTPVPKP